MSISSHENLLDNLLGAKSPFIPSLHVSMSSSKRPHTVGREIPPPGAGDTEALVHEVLRPAMGVRYRGRSCSMPRSHPFGCCVRLFIFLLLRPDLGLIWSGYSSILDDRIPLLTMAIYFANVLSVAASCLICYNPVPAAAKPLVFALLLKEYHDLKQF